MKTSESVTNLIKARIAAKRIMDKPRKDAVNPHFKSKYTSYEELISCVERALAPNGLDMVVELLENEGKVGCQITLYHESGEWMQTEKFYLPANQTSQGYGSAATYVLRYCISAFWSIAGEDDDGNAATPPKKKPESREVNSAGRGETGLNQRQHAQKILMTMCTNKGIPTEYRRSVIKREFGKESVTFLDIDELRRLYRILEGWKGESAIG